MENIVGVIKATDKIAAFQDLLALTGFEDNLIAAWNQSGKDKQDFRIIIKPNMMVFVHQQGYQALITDKDLVEFLVDHIRGLGFSEIVVCEAENDAGSMLRNHNVAFVADKIGYRPDGRYRIANLTEEAVPFAFPYQTRTGKVKTWKDVVGRSWQEADYRITFAKCKSHEHDWMTLGVKNVYGTFPRSNKVSRYHIMNEVWSATSRLIRSFPVHFSFVDAWLCSDGFQGYKIAHPKDIKMLFGGADALAVDMEIFRRAGLDPTRSRFLEHLALQVYGGVFPDYSVRGDQDTLFEHITDWENVGDDVVNCYNFMEEIYISWAFFNLRVASDHVDYDMFPPRTIFSRLAAWLSKKLFSFYKWLKKIWPF